MTTEKISSALLAPITKNGIFFAFMYLLGAVCVLFVVYDGSRAVAIFQLFSDLYLLCAALLLLPAGIRRYVRGLLGFVFYALAVVDVACYVRLGSPIIPIYWELLLHTNAREAGEALSSYLSWEMVFSPLGLVLLLMIIHAVCAWGRRRVCQWPLRVKGRWGKPTIAVLVTGLAGFGFFVTLDEREYVYYRVVRGLDELEVQQIKDFTPKTKYYIPVYRLVYAVSENRQLADTRRGLHEAFDKAEVTGCSQDSSLIVLIIGESCNRHHLGAYGYGKPTTPFLSDRVRKGETILFSDVVSPWNVTCETFENILSTHCADMPGNWSDYPFFPQLFRLAGYHTAFYSNQYIIGSGGVSVFKEDLFINNPALSPRMFDVRNDSTHRFDMGLIGDYQQNASTAPAQLLVFHYLGVHANFAERFPQDSVRFKAGDYDRPDLSEGGRQLLADYDNALRYNDYVTESILRQFEGKEAIIVFLSDHGERMFDFNTREWARTLVWNTANVRQQYEIPFWIYATPAYQQKHADTWQRIIAASNKPMLTDALPHLMLYLAGIETPWYSERHNILSDGYDADRPRPLNGERLYSDFVEDKGSTR